MFPVEPYLTYLASIRPKTPLTSSNVKSINKCKFSVIRFGNVIGSRGSVLLKFINQIKNNQEITVTHKEMTRFFISIESAVKNVLKSILMMRGGEVFIIKNLKAFKIIDLAYALKKIYNSRSKVIVIKPHENEKLFEQMLHKNELNQIDNGRWLFYECYVDEDDRNNYYSNALKNYYQTK